MRWREVTQSLLVGVVERSTSAAQVFRVLDMDVNGGNYITFKSRLAEWNIDASHFLGSGHLRGSTSRKERPPLESVLTVNSSYSRSKLKKRLVSEGVMEEQCAWCGIGPSWNGKPLTLELDHINGVNDDNRLENLRLLCPNCHSQTPTSCRSRRKTKKQYACAECGRRVGKGSARCRNCANRANGARREAETGWPSDNVLAEMVSASNINATARRLGLSFNAVKRRMSRINARMLR